MSSSTSSVNPTTCAKIRRVLCDAIADRIARHPKGHQSIDDASLRFDVMKDRLQILPPRTAVKYILLRLTKTEMKDLAAVLTTGHDDPAREAAHKLLYAFSQNDVAAALDKTFGKNDAVPTPTIEKVQAKEIAIDKPKAQPVKTGQSAPSMDGNANLAKGNESTSNALCKARNAAKAKEAEKSRKEYEMKSDLLPGYFDILIKRLDCDMFDVESKFRALMGETLIGEAQYSEANTREQARELKKKKENLISEIESSAELRSQHGPLPLVQETHHWMRKLDEVERELYEITRRSVTHIVPANIMHMEYLSLLQEEVYMYFNEKIVPQFLRDAYKQTVKPKIKPGSANTEKPTQLTDFPVLHSLIFERPKTQHAAEQLPLHAVRTQQKHRADSPTAQSIPQKQPITTTEELVKPVSDRKMTAPEMEVFEVNYSEMENAKTSVRQTEAAGAGSSDLETEKLVTDRDSDWESVEADLDEFDWV